MARTVIFSGAGLPLSLVEVPIPALLEGEILVRIRCCTICSSDLHTHAGRREEPVPTVLGHEIVGVIEAFGPAAAREDAMGATVYEGSRISWSIAASCGRCFFCENELPQKCECLYKYGHQRVSATAPLCGGLADYIVLTPGTALFTVPDAVSDRVAATANCAVATVASVFRAAGPVEGRSVMVLGAGMLGVTACAMARTLGADAVFASDPDPASLQRAGQFGATHLLSADPKETAEGVAETTGGRGTDLVLELSGALTAVQSSFFLARIGGVVVLAGSVMPQGALSLNPELVVRKSLTIRGVHNYHPRDLGYALTFLAGGGRGFPFESLIVAEYPLEQVEQAFHHAHASRGVRVAVAPR